MESTTKILLVFFTVLVYFAVVNSVCVESEREALLKFKESASADVSSVLSSWTGSDCCSWDGVKCHNLTGNVKNLELNNPPSGNNFSSTLSPWLFNLTHIEVLSLFAGFRGPIPDMFDKLTTLSEVYLPNVVESALPDSLCSLTGLRYVDIGYSELQGSVPTCLVNMTSLIHHQLNGENVLTAELADPFFRRLENLWKLRFHSTRFRVFNVSSQWIPSFNVWDVLISNVLIGTPFPLWLQSRSIRRIVMSNVSISGMIPDWFQSPGNPNLYYFDLSNNLLTGPVPTFNATNYAVMEVLDLSGNMMSGTIPEELCRFSSLIHLSLANNQLTGTIPLCLGNLHHLAVLDLSYNNLNGRIPSELGFCQHLAVLHLDGNNLSGEIPLLQNLSLLITLDLGENQLQGLIPDWMAKEYFPYLQFLRLEHNNLSSVISASLCELPSLQILNLAHNNLAGMIPSCLGNLSRLLLYEPGRSSSSSTYTDSILNDIKGTEREYSLTLKYSKFISLSGNHLHGEIPVELMNLQGLQSLDLSNNELTGMIPERIDNMKQLESLDLSMNRLSGTIPQSLAVIDSLSYLNLSFNNFSGRIPSGNHFDTLYNASIYKGNSGLCGKLLAKSCPGDDSPNGPVSDGDDDEFDQVSWLYAGIGPGFAAGFLAVICTLYFKDPWRIAYFGFVDNVCDRVWVTYTIKISQLRRKFN